MSDRPARYELVFAGKDEARRLVHEPASTRLVPDRMRSTEFATAHDVFIEGENLEALKLLAPSYFGQVQMIYIDPPYNTGNDFVYRDDYRIGRREYLQQSGQVDAMGQALVANPETAGRFHSTWLSMMFPRLCCAHQLLRDDGVLFVSIGDHEVHNLRLLLDEIFGQDNFIAQVIVVSNRGGRDYLPIAITHEYVLVYGRGPDAKIRELPKEGVRPDGEDGRGPYVLRELRNRNPRFHPGNRPNLAYPIHVAPDIADDGGRLAVWFQARPGYTVEVVPRNRLGAGSVWRWSRDRLAQHVVADDPAASEVVARRRRDGGYNVYEKYRKQTAKPRGVWDDPAFRSEQGTRDLAQVLGAGMFDHPKPVELIRRCVQIGTDPDGIVLDFFAGSGTTAQAVGRQNRIDGGVRRFIAVQAPVPVDASGAAAKAGHRTVGDVAIERVRRLSLDERPRRGLRVFQTDSIDGNEGVWEVLLEEGIGPDSRFEALPAFSQTWRVIDRGGATAAVVCLERCVDRALVHRLGVGTETLLVCRDQAIDLATAVNFGLQGRLRLVTCGEAPV